jgi:S13-like H2TH domain
MQGRFRLTAASTRWPDYLSGAEVVELLLAVPKIGPARAARLLNAARVSQSKTVGGFSHRQRACLIELLSRLRRGPTT